MATVKYKDRNSIYEYYRKVTDRCYTSLSFFTKGHRETVYLWEPLAREIEVNGYTDYDLFVTGQPKKLQVHEGITGTIIIDQRDAEERIVRRGTFRIFLDHLSAEICRRGGKAFLNRTIVETLYDCGGQTSPRYKKKQEKHEEDGDRKN